MPSCIGKGKAAALSIALKPARVWKDSKECGRGAGLAVQAFQGSGRIRLFLSTSCVNARSIA